MAGTLKRSFVAWRQTRYPAERTAAVHLPTTTAFCFEYGVTSQLKDRKDSELCRYEVFGFNKGDDGTVSFGVGPLFLSTCLFRLFFLSILLSLYCVLDSWDGFHRDFSRFTMRVNFRTCGLVLLTVAADVTSAIKVDVHDIGMQSTVPSAVNR